MKDAYYFTHDSNARNDPKIVEMRSVYGAQGYGWYWMLIEMLREQDNYTLDINSKYAFNAFALQLHCESDAAQKFIKDCINEFKLFASDGQCFWSESLVRRMNIMKEKSQKARNSALSRWGKEPDANAMQTQSERNASKLKKRKVKESKVKDLSKINYAENVTLTEEEYTKLLTEFGQVKTDDFIERLNLYKGSTGTPYKSDYMTILNWDRKDKQKGGPPNGQARGTSNANSPKPPGKYAAAIARHAGLPDVPG